MNGNEGSGVSTRQPATQPTYSLSINDLNSLLQGGTIRIGDSLIYLDHQAQIALRKKINSTQ